MPRIAQLPRAPDSAIGAAADPDLGLWRGARLGRRVPVRPVTALERRLAAPERAHQPDRLVAAAAAPLERDAHELELVAVPAHADPEREAAAGELLQRRHLLRQVERIVQGHEHDRGAEPDPLSPAGDPAERDERVVHAAIRVHRFRPDDDVLRRPDGVEAEHFRRLRERTDAGRRRLRTEVRQDHAEVHEPRLTAARVARLATTDPDGRPHLVPIVFALDGDTLYSAVDRKPKRSRTLRRIQNARARPDATILVDHYEDERRRLRSTRLRGRARVLDDGPERERALELLAAKYPQYRTEPPDGPVLAVDVTEVREWRGGDA